MNLMSIFYLNQEFSKKFHTAIESSRKSQKTTKLKLRGMYNPRGICYCGDTAASPPTHSQQQTERHWYTIPIGSFFQ